MDPKDPNQLEEEFRPPPPAPSRIEQILEEERLKKKEEEKQRYGLGALTGSLAFAFLLSRFRKKAIEEEKIYRETEKKQKEEWLKNNPGKNFSINEGLDYLYGSLDDPIKPSLHQDVMSNIKKQSDLYEKYSKDKKNPGYQQYKHYEKYKKLLEKYGKKKTKTNNNAEVVLRKKQIKKEIEQRLKLLKQDLLDVDKNFLIEKIKTQRWAEFVEEYQETAKEYAKTDEEIKRAYDHWETKQQAQISQEPTQEEIKKRLEEIDKNKKLKEEAQSLEEERLKKKEEEDKKQNTNWQQLEDDLNENKPPEPQKPRENPIKQARSRFSRFRDLSRRISNQRLGTRFINRANNLGRTTSGLRSFGGSTGNVLRGARGGVQTALRMGAQAARLAPLLANPVTLIIIIVVVIIIIVFVIILSIGGGNGEFGPSSTYGTSLDYTIAFKNPNILPRDTEEAKRLVKNSFPNARLENWETIIQQSIANGWNPAFVLTLWIEETGASNCTKTENGGGGVKCGKDEDGNPVSSKGHLGCAPWKNQTLDESLTCLFNSFSIDKFSIDDFESFMCVYGGDGFHRAPCTFNVSNPDFPRNIRNWYAKLVPFGYGSLVPKPTPTIGDRGLSLSGRSGIVEAARYITTRLYKKSTLYDGNIDEPNTPTYWCTFIITDSYNKIGLTDLTRSAHGSVVNMKIYFSNTTANGGKYRMLSKDVDAKQLQPGDVIFFEGTGGQHVILIKSKDEEIETLGRGAIYTYESNGFATEDVVFVDNFRVLNARNTRLPITGFGQPIKL